MQAIKQYKGLPKEMYVLFGANIINRLGDFVSPMITLYLTQKLEMTPQSASFIVMIVLFTRFPGAVVGGKIADTIGRKHAYLILQFLAGLSLLPCAFNINGQSVIILLIVATLLNGAVRPSLDALVVDILPQTQRNAGMGLMYLGINIGVAVGPAIAGFLFKSNLPLFFILDGVTSFVAVIVVGVLISQKSIDKSINKEEKEDTFHKTSKEHTNIWTYMKSNKKLLAFILIFTSFAMIYVQIKFSVPILFGEVFGENSSIYIGWMFTVNAVTVVLLTAFVTEVTSKNSSIKNVAIGGLFYGVGFGLFGVFHSFLGYMFATFIWTLGEILMHINGKVYIANHSPIHLRGRVNAVYNSFSALSNTLGVVIAGSIIPIIGASIIWFFVAGFAFVCCTGIILIHIDQFFVLDKGKIGEMDS